MTNPRCPDCEGLLVYVGDLAAPGHGDVYRCPTCSKQFVVMGRTVIDPRDIPADEPPPWVDEP